MKLRKNKGDLERLPDSRISWLEMRRYTGESVTEIDCGNLIVENGLGWCPIYGILANLHPCVDDCQCYRPMFINGNRECYDGRS